VEKFQNHQRYYDEHASQARMHEEQRERATNIILSISGVLVALITFSKLSYGALPAAISIILLGVYGYLFAGKHYERNRLHTEIMRSIRLDIERVLTNPDEELRPMSVLRAEGERSHYKHFRWPGPDERGSGSRGGAHSWIARRRLHVFWELIHVAIAVLGLALCISIFLNDKLGDHEKPTKVELTNFPGKVLFESEGGASTARSAGTR
jgi:hypothetical protein